MLCNCYATVPIFKALRKVIFSRQLPKGVPTISVSNIGICEKYILNKSNVGKIQTQ